VVSEGDEPLDWGTNNGASQVKASVDNNIAKVAWFSNPVNCFDDEDPDNYEDSNFHRQANSSLKKSLTQAVMNLSSHCRWFELRL
jgi:hypothetical protein